MIIGTYIGVVEHPDLAEAVVHVIVEEARVLRLGVVVALQDDGNEDFEEHQVHYEHVAHEVRPCEELASATYRTVVVSDVILISRVL
jgi:hypothetical protein